MLPTPPVLTGLPLLGNALAFSKDRHTLLNQGFRTLGPVFTIHLGPRPVAVMIGPDFQQMFFSETDKTLSINKPYEALKAILGNVLFLADKETYKEQRPVIYAPFRHEKMVKYVQIMQREVTRWLDGLGESGEMEISTEMNRLVQNIAGSALMGDAFQNQVGREFWDLYTELGKTLDMVTPPHWPTPKNLRREKIKQRMREFLRPIIEERRRHPEDYDDFLQDFINTRFTSGELADDITLIDLLRSFMFASHETTAGQAAWTVIEITRHPEYRSLVEAEVAQNLPPGAEISSQNMRALQHIAWAVREVERLHPSADMLLRVAEQDLEVGGYRIPQGWMLMVSAAVAHRLPELFTDPERFDPLRYAPERAEDAQHRFALIGFGGGGHKCAGMNFANNEMTIITALLFQRFHLELRTEQIGLNFGLGAVRPTPTSIRYCR
jgi:sterol 14-demethylase